VFKHKFDMEGTCGDAFLIRFIEVFTNDVSKLFKPLDDVSGGDVSVFEHCDEDFISRTWFRNCAKSKDFAKE
jgi:hypothetical protein